MLAQHKLQQLNSLVCSRLGRVLQISLFIVALQTLAFAGDSAPDWLKQAAATAAPTFEKNVPAVVLLNERRIKVDESGKVTTTERYAVRILSIEGRREARGSVTYTTDTGKVKEMQAWVLRRNEEVKKYGRVDTVDIAAAFNDVFNEVRVKLINVSHEVIPGEVFGYEIISEDRSIFTQFDWLFQDRLPSLVSRFSITLPAQWRVDHIVFNHPRVEPATLDKDEKTYTWELRDLPFIEDEIASPPVTNLVPRLAISYFPPDGVKTKLGRSFENWADVSQWLTELSDPQMIINEPIVRRAKEVTAGAKTELEKIQAIGRYCQSVNYISIQTGTGRGGGYRPHSSADVFKKSYGDCKDKANLMRAMLKAIGIPSYLTSLYAGDSSYVREAFPSPQQFNHCIIAVSVSNDTQAATIVQHPALGRLLIFDPTDENTPVGDLPEHEQGGLALIIAKDQRSLLRLPVTPPEWNHLERRVEASLQADGSITARISEQTRGQAAVDFRREFRGLSAADYVKQIERWITRNASGVNVLKVEPVDFSREGRFSLNVDFAAARYGQLMQGRLLLFKPAIISRRESLFFSEAARKNPVQLEPHAYTEVVHVKLPEGFAVDELPEAVKLRTPFGSYSTGYEVKGSELNFTRSLDLRGATIPVSGYPEVRDFFASIRAAEEAPVVLAKK